MAANVQVVLDARVTNAQRWHKVYLRRNWTEGWVQVPWLFAEQVTWAIAPSVGAATLAWRFGQGMRQGELTPGTVARLSDRLQYFVKVEIESEAANDPLLWFGTLEIEAQTMLGLLGLPGGAIPSGEQRFSCVGLEQALRRHAVTATVWREDSGAERASQRTQVFNQPDATGKVAPNCSPAAGLRGPLFSGTPLGTGEDPIPANPFTSRRIVQYLVGYFKPPIDPFGELPFQIDQTALLLVPHWDQPVIDPEGKSVGELLDEALPRGRGLSWKIAVQADNTISVVPISLLGAPVQTPLGQLAANPRRLAINADHDPSWSCTPQGFSLHLYHQVRVRGARRSSTCTLSVSDATIEKGWTSAQETGYEAAASGEAGYAGWGTQQRQMVNADARANAKYYTVFRRFQIPLTWNQKVRDADGGGNPQAVFRQDDNDSATTFPVNPRELWILPALPLKDGYTYTNLGTVDVRTAPVKAADGPHNHLPPLVIFKDPEQLGGADRFLHVEKIAAAADLEDLEDNPRRWHGTVAVPEQDRAVLVNVHNGPQHVLASFDFTRLSEDPYVGQWDWRYAYFTVALADDRHCEGVYPSDAALLATVLRPLRVLELDAGDGYRQDWLVPNTIIGVDPLTGAKQRCTGGGWINDDRKLLAARARMAFEYYSEPRQAAVFRGRDLVQSIELGDFVESWGAADVVTLGGVVSEITVEIPAGEPGSLSAPTITFTTAFAELDPAVFLTR